MGRTADRQRWLRATAAAMLLLVVPPAAARPAATAAQRVAAAHLVAATRLAMARYQDVRRAEAAGYRRLPAQADIIHFENTAYLADGLDPQHPQSLVYLDGPSGLRLVAAMFIMGQPDQSGPRVGGPLTPWHTHTTCYGAAGPALPGSNGRCPIGDYPQTTAQMLHVWAASVGGDPFAGSMNPYARQCQVAHSRALTST